MVHAPLGLPPTERHIAASTMTAIALIAWMMSGLLAARAVSGAGDWRPWAPVAVIFGPLWLALATEQRASPSDVDDT